MNFLEANTDAVFSRLSDEESREIFRWRYEYFKSGDHAAFYRRLVADGANSINRYNQLRRDAERRQQPDAEFYPDAFDFLDNKSAWPKGIILYGAGVIMPHYAACMKTLGIEIKAVCDTHKQGGMYGENRIVSVEEALALRDGAAILITTVNQEYQREIRQKLIKLGVPESEIYVAIDAIDNSVAAYIRQYFVDGIMEPAPNEVFIDAGCLDGTTILAFRKFAGAKGYKHIYGFEPEKASFDVTNRNMRDNGVENVTILNKGLWNTAETLRFRTDNSIGSAGIAANGDATIETVRLDDVMEQCDKVTFIKMDIEGAELNALYGASGIIRRDKPRLAICVYHKPEDILEIPAYILSLNPEYKLYLRHYTPMYEWETVLYAI